jgi:nucleoside-diphosphate-sugar epimerase
MKIAVTGANGFVGTAVCQRLGTDGHEVRSIVRRAGSGVDGTEEFLIDDVFTTESWPDALAGQDAVIHLAAHVHQPAKPGDDSIDQYRRINTSATLRLAAAAASAGIKNFVFMSSVAAHGDAGDANGFTFTVDQASAPRTPYGISKFEAEEGLREVATTSMSVTAVRIPMVYGPRAPGNFARLLSLVHSGVPLPFAAVRNRRTLISQWNLADAVAHELTTERSGFRLIQVADREPISTPDLMRAISAGLGRRARLWAAPPTLLRGLGRLAGRSSEVDRLVGSLEVLIGSTDPGFSWAPPGETRAEIVRAAQLWSERKRASA